MVAIADVALRPLEAKAQTIFPVNLIHPLIVRAPPLPTQQNINSEVAIPCLRRRPITDARRQQCLI